jgi:hypothetical protein
MAGPMVDGPGICLEAWRAPACPRADERIPAARSAPRPPSEQKRRPERNHENVRFAICSATRTYCFDPQDLRAPSIVVGRPRNTAIQRSGARFPSADIAPRRGPVALREHAFAGNADMPPMAVARRLLRSHHRRAAAGHHKRTG